MKNFKECKEEWVKKYDCLKSEIYNILLYHQITNNEKLYLFNLLDGTLLEENYELGSYIIKNKMSVRQY